MDIFTISTNDTVKRCCCICGFIFVFIILVAAILWKCSSEGKLESFTNLFAGNIKTLKASEDLNAALTKSPALVAVLADWCGYCKKLKQSGALDKVAKKFKVVIIDDNHPQTKQVMESTQSQGFPTLAIFDNGKLHKYEGPRDHSSIIQELSKYKSSSDHFAGHGAMIDVPLDATSDQYYSLLSDMDRRKKKVVTAVLADWCGHCKKMKQNGTLEDLVAKGVTVIKLSDKHKMAKELGVPGYPFILYLKGGKNVPYEGERSASAIVAKMQ